MKNENIDPSYPVIPGPITLTPVPVLDRNQRNQYAKYKQRKAEIFMQLWFRYFFVIPISIIIFTAFIMS